MMHIVHKLKNIKTENTSRSGDLNGMDAHYFFVHILHDIKHECSKIEDRDEIECFAVLGSKNGALPIAISTAKYIPLVFISKEAPEKLLLNNFKEWKTGCEIVVGKDYRMLSNIKSISIIGPSLNKGEESSLNDINYGMTISDIGYTLYKREHINNLLSKYPRTNIIGELEISVPFSKKYGNSHNNGKSIYNVVKILK